MASALAAASTHPLSRALSASLGPAPALPAPIREVPGQGVEAVIGGDTWRLGSAAWCGLPSAGESALSEIRLSRNGKPEGCYRFADQLRSGAAGAVSELAALGLPSRLLSGDHPQAVAAVAEAAGIVDAKASLRPEQKVAEVEADRTMMVGDGINDAPALRAAYVSMAPSSAADIGRSAADFVFTGEDLGAVPFVIATARRAAALVNQNLVIAIGYNAIAVPLAIAGQVTPLIAAVAMSSSSVMVVANALRLRFEVRGRTRLTALAFKERPA
jgi:Cu2+-exporting ATPase